MRLRLLCSRFLLAVFAFALAASAADKPNVILIMADDFGYECVTANGGESYQTPHLDKLAQQGVRFTQCYVQPLCTPTRVQLMTGQYNVRNYLNFGTLVRKETTFGHFFKQAGYKTGICGKWQLGRETDSPQHFGFEESCLWQHTRRPPRYANPGLEYNGVAKDFDNGEYGPKLVNEFAIDFVTRHKGEPFFLYYPMMLTHGPFQPTPDSPDWDPKAIGENVNNNQKHFAAMVQYMDKLTGELVAKLDELKIRDNTLLVFIGDNGTGAGLPSKFEGKEIKGGKGTTTHRGTHVPLIVNWPAGLKKSAVSNDLISSVDVLPTICAAAGVPVHGKIDGVSFLPQLRGEKGTPREALYTWYSPRQQANLTVREFAQNHHYKLYRTGEFYDLTADLEEKTPLTVTDLKGHAKAAATSMQGVLDQYKDARPAELDRAFQQAGGEEQPKKKNKNKKKQ
jgi:arylsulfatase A